MHDQVGILTCKYVAICDAPSDAHRVDHPTSSSDRLVRSDWFRGMCGPENVCGPTRRASAAVTNTNICELRLHRKYVWPGTAEPKVSSGLGNHDENLPGAAGAPGALVHCQVDLQRSSAKPTHATTPNSRQRPTRVQVYSWTGNASIPP